MSRRQRAPGHRLPRSLDAAIEAVAEVEVLGPAVTGVEGGPRTIAPSVRTGHFDLLCQ